ncbi:hypothetical protein MMC06_005655 [Schaereria dolodes]|nr:hypothetical protein [Schaereria dolodes]
MSATTSPQPTDGPPTLVEGFNTQTYYDPVLPTSSSEEHLTQITGDFLMTDVHPSRSHALAYDASSELQPTNSLPSNSYMDFAGREYRAQFKGNFATYNDARESSLSPEVEGTAQIYHNMSPLLGLSDSDYSGVQEDFATSFGADLDLERTYGPLDILEYGIDVSQNQDVGAINAQEPMSATTTKSFNSAHTSRISNGTATHTSHLMSPVLTDTTSPSSGFEVASPLSRTRLLGGGPMSRVSSHSTNAELAKMDRQAAYAQHTPAMTGSSVEATPEPGSVRHTSLHVSPVVRIESYSRGDSPARTAISMERSPSKRSQASRFASHLAAPNDESSEDGEDNIDDGGRIDLRSRPLRLPRDKKQPSSYNDDLSTRFGLDPDARSQIASDFIPNFKDQEERAQMDLRNAEVEDWLAKSEAGTDDQGDAFDTTRNGPRKDRRRRARSTGDNQFYAVDALHLETSRYTRLGPSIPGPGILLKEESGEEESEADDIPELPESPPTAVEIGGGAGYFPKMAEDSEAQYDAHPWGDPIYFPSFQVNAQPITANAAMMLFGQRAADIETASRAATWGTRRMSEADLEKITDSLLHRLSFGRDKGKEKSERRGSFFEQAAAKLLPKRSNSNIRRNESESTKEPVGQATPEHSRKESLGSHRGSPTISTSLRRMSSIGKRPKSPMLNTSGAFAAMTSQIAALGNHGSMSPVTNTSPADAWSSARNVLKRKTRGDNHHLPSSSTTNLGLTELWVQQGGPPMPAIASPTKENLAVIPSGQLAEEEEDIDTDELMDEKGVTMDFTPRDDLLIVPNLEGFKANIRDINPRLPVFMIDRNGHEQLRRYKKLVEFKVKHAQAIQHGKCSSGDRCTHLGGSPIYHPHKGLQKEVELSHTGFSTTEVAPSEDDPSAVIEGSIVSTQFPAGVPVPPVSRLPAEFECPLCFIVKKFQKPSDWSKHVHEDVQPFTCTFPTCSEPKSFKRKADWVRHENERHRQLEWWVCNIHDCSHKCYRRDNFVQHLVREHKLPEPKAKTAKPNKPAVRGPAKNRVRVTKDAAEYNGSDDSDIVLRLVEECRHETTKRPVDEPCRFCGNICNSWKKLTVHLSKHMEQISMPILGLVEQKDVTPETVISPIEQQMSTQAIISPLAQPDFTRRESVSLSPHEMPLGLVNVKTEFPGSVVSSQNPSSYVSNPNGNHATGAFGWGRPLNQTHQGGEEMSHISFPLEYNPGTGARYQNYHSAAAVQPVPVNVSTKYRPGSLGSNSNAAYHGVDGSIAHLQPISYTGGHPYPVSISQQPTYSVPTEALQYTNQPNFPSSNHQEQQIEAQVPLPYHGMSSISHPHTSHNSSYFDGQQSPYYPYQP